jgi:hypothetical protein
LLAAVASGRVLVSCWLAAVGLVFNGWIVSFPSWPELGLACLGLLSEKVKKSCQAKMVWITVARNPGKKTQIDSTDRAHQPHHTPSPATLAAPPATGRRPSKKSQNLKIKFNRFLAVFSCFEQ